MTRTILPLAEHAGKQLAPGLTGRYIHGESMTLGVVDIVAGSSLSMHSHPHEQITFILEGELDMTIGDEQLTLKAGMSYVIPSNVPHGATAHVNCRVLDVFAPVREDYR
ncbi:MAG: cupin domain-containing protein [Chitinophagaceae bacterium]